MEDPQIQEASGAGTQRPGNSRQPIEQLVPLREKWWPESFTLIRDAAETFGWTLTELADRMNYGHNQIWRKSRAWDMPNSPLLLRMCEAVQLPFSKVVAGQFQDSPLLKGIALPAGDQNSSNGGGILTLLLAQAPPGEAVTLQNPLLRQVKLRRTGPGNGDVEIVLDTVGGLIRLHAGLATS